MLFFLVQHCNQLQRCKATHNTLLHVLQGQATDFTDNLDNAFKTTPLLDCFNMLKECLPLSFILICSVTCNHPQEHSSYIIPLLAQGLPHQGALTHLPYLGKYLRSISNIYVNSFYILPYIWVQCMNLQRKHESDVIDSGTIFPFWGNKNHMERQTLTAPPSCTHSEHSVSCKQAEVFTQNKGLGTT